MEKQSKLTLIGFIVVIFVILFAISMIMPVLSKISKIASKVVCPTNLKGLGTAMYVYAIDYDDNYPQLPGTGPWSQELGFDYDMKKPNFINGGAEGNVSRTITASLYLLVREADVSPKSFVCSKSDQKEFYGRNPKNWDIVDLWDFGYNPYEHVSYAYHNPYGNFPPDATSSAAFAIAADMNPWFNNGNFVIPGSANQSPQLLTISDLMAREQVKKSNASHHGYEGQNVLYGDGHTSFEKTPNVGVKNDNIYTYWSAEENPTEQDTQGGTAPTSRGPENDAKSKDDSFLAI